MRAALRVLTRVAPTRVLPRTTLRPTWIAATHRIDVRQYASAAAAAVAEKPAPPPIADAEGSEKAVGGPEPLSNRYADLKGRIRYPLWKAITVKPYQYTEMTDVQQAVFSHFPKLAASPSDTPLHKDVERGVDESLLQAQDLLVRAKTGTGKTIAFLVPVIEARIREIESFRAKWKAENPTGSGHHLSEATKAYLKSSTGALILSPTRELATQIAAEAEALTHHLDDWGVRLFVGGGSKARQLHRFSREASNIIVATPGRCLDLIESEPAVRERIANSRALVLDEADTLLDMGFADELGKIVDAMKPVSERQTFLFSATVSPGIRQIARKFLKRDHLFINTVRPEDIDVHMHIPQTCTVLSSAEEQIMHVLRLIAQDQLEQGILNREREFKRPGKAIIFLPTTRMTQLFAIMLDTMRTQLPSGLRSRIFEISSRKDQRQRERASDMFRRTDDVYSILVTSDVSARGVDYPNVTRVIQVGVPSSRDIYIHRIGRTGRAGKKGRGDLVLLPWESEFVKTNLRDLPLKTLTVSRLKNELAKMTPGAVDADGKPLSEERESDFSNKHFSKDIARRLGNMQEVLETNVLPTFGEESVSEACASLLGYYASKTSDLRISKRDILEGLKEWSTETMKLERPPHMSSSFLAKLGFNSDRDPFRTRRKASSLSHSFERGGSFHGSRDSGGGRRGKFVGGSSSSRRGDEEDAERPSTRYGSRFDRDRNNSHNDRPPRRSFDNNNNSYDRRGGNGGNDRRGAGSFDKRGSYSTREKKSSWFDD